MESSRVLSVGIWLCPEDTCLCFATPSTLIQGGLKRSGWIEAQETDRVMMLCNKPVFGYGTKAEGFYTVWVGALNGTVAIMQCLHWRTGRLLLSSLVAAVPGPGYLVNYSKVLETITG